MNQSLKALILQSLNTHLFPECFGGGGMGSCLISYCLLGLMSLLLVLCHVSASSSSTWPLSAGVRQMRSKGSLGHLVCQLIAGVVWDTKWLAELSVI